MSEESFDIDQQIRDGNKRIQEERDERYGEESEDLKEVD